VRQVAWWDGLAGVVGFVVVVVIAGRGGVVGWGKPGWSIGSGGSSRRGESVFVFVIGVGWFVVCPVHRGEAVSAITVAVIQSARPRYRKREAEDSLICSPLSQRVVETRIERSYINCRIDTASRDIWRGAIDIEYTITLFMCWFTYSVIFTRARLLTHILDSSSHFDLT
jgi:hypothetical protein